MRANHTPHLRAVRMRRIRRRFYLADGVISIYCIKVIPPPDNDRCRWCGCPTDPGEHCEICGTYNPYGALYHGPERPEQWTPCYKTGCEKPGTREFEMAFWCDEHYAEFQPSPWPGGAA